MIARLTSAALWLALAAPAWAHAPSTAQPHKVDMRDAVMQGSLSLGGGAPVSLTFQGATYRKGVALPPAPGPDGDHLERWLDPITEVPQITLGEGADTVIALTAKILGEHMAPLDTIQTYRLWISLPPEAAAARDRQGAALPLEGAQIWLHIDKKSSSKPLYRGEIREGALKISGRAATGALTLDLTPVAPLGEPTPKGRLTLDVHLAL